MKNEKESCEIHTSDITWLHHALDKAPVVACTRWAHDQVSQCYTNVDEETLGPYLRDKSISSWWLLGEK